jgi:hypothetical protein
MSAARAFPLVGDELWRQPASRLFRSLARRELARLPEDARAMGDPDTRHVPGWPADKPYFQSWSNKPRLYPPGDLVLVAPVALAYHHTALSFSGATELLIVLFVFYGHVGLLLALATLYPFFLLWPALSQLSPNIPIGLGMASMRPASLGLFVLVWAAGAAALAWARAWLDLATCAWMALMLLTVRET